VRPASKPFLISTTRRTTTVPPTVQYEEQSLTLDDILWLKESTSLDLEVNGTNYKVINESVPVVVIS